MIIGILLLLLGIAGSLLPVVPGPPLCYLALLLQQLKDVSPFSTSFLILWGILVVLVSVLDYAVPVYGTKKFGGSRYGVWGCMIGFLAAFWMGPWGIVIGPFMGAFLGEVIAHRDSTRAFRAAFGSFTGFLFGTLLKLVSCFVMGYYLVRSLWS
jgi:uncharacterized protein YqgC (DUF456 family)